MAIPNGENEMALYDDCVDDEEPADIAGFLDQTDYLESLGEALKLFDRLPGLDRLVRYRSSS